MSYLGRTGPEWSIIDEIDFENGHIWIYEMNQKFDWRCNCGTAEMNFVSIRRAKVAAEGHTLGHPFQHEEE